MSEISKKIKIKIYAQQKIKIKINSMKIDFFLC